MVFIWTNNWSWHSLPLTASTSITISARVLYNKLSSWLYPSEIKDSKFEWLKVTELINYLFNTSFEFINRTYIE